MSLMSDIFIALSRSIDLIDTRLGSHNKRVAYIAGRLSHCIGLQPHEITKAVIAAALHDIGIIKEPKLTELIDFNYIGGVDYHSILGYKLLSSCELTKDIAPIVKYHHVPFNERDKIPPQEVQPMLSEIIHLADRVDVFVDYHSDLFEQKDLLMQFLHDQAGKRFNPELVQCFSTIAQIESFWFDLQYNNIEKCIKDYIFYNPYLSLEQIHDIGLLFTKVIDFRSRFTSTHSTSVARVARKLGELLNFSERECLMLDIAGHLHDIGKLAIPVSILEKPDKLNQQEWRIMKRHTYFTYRILESIDNPIFKIINEWASLHHEKIDGNGYPFKVPPENLTLGSRIMAVADMFTALAESRPYRNSMDDEAIKNEFTKIKGISLDPHVVDVLLDNYEVLKEVRVEAFCNALNEFEKLHEIELQQ